MTWLSSARLNTRISTDWRISGPSRMRADRNTNTDVLLGKDTGTGNGNGRPTQQGLIVVDDMFRLIAADRGALNILSGEAGGSAAVDEIPLPGRLAESLKAAGTNNVPVRIGTQPYLCRTFELRSAGGAGPAIPAAAIYLQRDISIVDFIDAVASEFHLTERERAAVEGVVMGLSSKEIAAEMKIAPNTVKSFLRTVMIKMGVSTRAAIVRKVLQFDREAS